MQGSDFSSLVLRYTIRAFGAGHPMRLVCGMLLGLILNQLRIALIQSNYAYLFLSGFGQLGCLGLGIGLVFLPLSWRKRVVEEDLRRTFDRVEEILSRGGLHSQYERRMAYQQLLAKVIEEYSPKRKSSSIIENTILVANKMSTEGGNAKPE